MGQKIENTFTIIYHKVTPALRPIHLLGYCLCHIVLFFHTFASGSPGMLQNLPRQMTLAVAFEL